MAVSELSRLTVAAVVAYLVSLQFVFPGYIKVPEPFHNDMYWSYAFHVSGTTFATMAQWPRPAMFETFVLAGNFGLEGSLVFLAAILLLGLALLLMLFERFVMRERLPIWLAFATLLMMMAGPGFYPQPAFDVGYHVAMLFGLLGIFAWEELSKRIPMLGLAIVAVCFSVSTLANEGFIPALVLYGCYSAWQSRSRPVLAVAIALLPLLAVGVAIADDRYTNSPFVALASKAANYPYRIDVTLPSLFSTTMYYIDWLLKPTYIILLLCCIAGLWHNRRLRLAAGILLLTCALYTPYIILPNHVSQLYKWPPIPFLALILPLAWIQKAAGRWRIANVALSIAVIFTFALQVTYYPSEKEIVRSSLEQNRAMIDSLRSHRNQIASAKNILVRGLVAESSPWAINSDVLPGIVPYTGVWHVVSEPGIAPVVPTANAQPIAPAAVRLRDYDLVLDVARTGEITYSVTH